MENNFEENLKEILDNGIYMKNEAMKKHTTFRVGGPADYYVIPGTEEEAEKVIACCRKEQIPFYMIGNGSNLLVSDQGYRGVIIQFLDNLNHIDVEEGKIIAQAGCLLSKIANTALVNQLAGFEFAAGIPGTLGGAVVMNAGAYGGEMKDVLESVKVVTQDGEIQEWLTEEMKLGYRRSRMQEEGAIVLSAVLRLEKGEEAKIKAVMDDLKQRRISKQPLEYPSAGSTFKRPQGHFAGELIEKSNLRGFTVGGAQISEKHCGFVINTGDATAADVLSLIRQVQDRVWDEFQVKLEPEVRMLGEF